MPRVRYSAEATCTGSQRQDQQVNRAANGLSCFRRQTDNNEAHCTGAVSDLRASLELETILANFFSDKGGKVGKS